MAGLDTVSTVLSFLFYEISLQPDVQKKLQKEIDEVITEKGHNNLEYTDLSKLKYLDMVVSGDENLFDIIILVSINGHISNGNASYSESDLFFFWK